jgi:hypothetical protein
MQRFGTAVGLAIVIAAILGFTGEGPLAHQSTQLPGGAFSLDYDRYVRSANQTSLQVQLNRAGQQRVAISQDYLSKFQIGTITPQPQQSTVLGDRTVFTFNVQPGAQLQFQVTPTQIGSHSGTVWTRDGRISFRQFVYP